MLVLASQSPRRKELLERAGFDPIVRVSGVPETRLEGEAPMDYVRRLARWKASAISRASGEIVLGADTVVVLDKLVLEKPRDAAHARAMLDMLSGRFHQVITGIHIRADAGEVTDSEVTTVWFTLMDRFEIEAYVQTGEPMDKAGAYAIQGYASRWVERIDGDYTNVVGLPVARVYQHLKALSAAELFKFPALASSSGSK